MKKYLLSLHGAKDNKYALIDKPLWDWIMSNDKGQLPQDKNKASWADQLTPESVQKELGQLAHISAGSWPNDRALQCNSDDIFFSTKELLDYCKKHRITIIDEFEGYLY